MSNATPPSPPPNESSPTPHASLRLRSGQARLTPYALLITHHSSRLTPYSSLLTPLFYLLISLIATWPLITHLRGWVPGLGDWGQNMWALWWVRHALLALGQSPFFTDYLFYPEGVTLLFHPLDVSDGLLVLPLYDLLGGDMSYNLLVLLSFVLGGWGAYLLALYLTHQRGASFVAGLVFALSPYHFLRLDLGHLNLSTIQWIPFYVLFLLRYLENGRRHNGLLAIFFLAFMALNSWYYVLYCGLLSLAALFWPGRNNPVPLGHRLRRIGLTLAGAGLLLSPLLMPMLRLMQDTVLIGEHNPLRHSVDLLSFWLPGPPSTWAGWFEAIWVAYAAQNREPGASAYLGYTVLVLSMVGLLARRARRQALWWAAVAVGFAVLGLGPQLQIGGHVYDVTLPYHWLVTAVPVFSIAGIPGRFVVMTSLALAILSACGLAGLLAGRRSAGGWSLLGLGLLIGLEYLAVPLRLSSTALPDFYHQAGAETENYAMLDIKWDANYLLHAQSIHHRPLVGGWLARLPAEQAAFLAEERLDQAFLHLLLGPDWQTTDPSDYSEAIEAALTKRDVRYIITHGGSAGPLVEQFTGWPVVYEGEGLVVYGRTENRESACLICLPTKRFGCFKEPMLQYRPCQTQSG